MSPSQSFDQRRKTKYKKNQLAQLRGTLGMLWDKCTMGIFTKEKAHYPIREWAKPMTLDGSEDDSDWDANCFRLIHFLVIIN